MTKTIRLNFCTQSTCLEGERFERWREIPLKTGILRLHRGVKIRQKKGLLLYDGCRAEVDDLHFAESEQDAPTFGQEIANYT